MKMARPTRKHAGRPSLRAAQARLTRERIEQALAELLKEGGVESITFKAVAAKAGVTEMTVYRHFPTRDELLKAIWQQMNREMGPNVTMPATLEALLSQHRELFTGFDRIPGQITASLTTPEGREMRGSLDRQRRRAFLAIVDEVAPGLSPQRRTQVAGVLQLLHSAHAWMSLREQWDLSGEQAGEVTRWVIELIVKDLRRKA